MKTKIVILALITFIGVNGQDKKNTDKIVETETRIITMVEDGKKVQKKIMVRTEKKQEVMTDPKYKGEVDRPRVFPETEVSEVIYIDNDYDPFYDEESDTKYYKEGSAYNFKRTDSGYQIMDMNTKNPYGTLRFSNNSDVYFLSSDKFNGIGYFENGIFTVEYYNEDGVLVVEHFKAEKM